MTYAGAYGRNERLPVDRVLRREGHPLGVRRAEATKVATAEEQEASTNHKRWTLGAAAGALLVAGTFAAGALGLSGGATPTAGTAPEHAPASPGHTPADGGGPVIGAPTSTQDDQQQQSTEDQQEQPQQTTPSSADPRAGIPVQANPNTGGGTNTGGDSQRTTTPGSSTTTPPATTEPAPETTTPPATDEDEGTGLGDVVGGVLDPVTDVVGGVLTPSSAKSSSTSAPAGPALTLIDPLGDLLAS